MRRIAIVTSVLLASPAHAADFRGSDLGSPCDSIKANEEAQNSTLIPWTPSEKEGFFAFKGRAFDREVTVLYLCYKGILRTGNYYFPLEPFDDALSSFKSVYESLTLTHGVPVLDNTPWQKDADPRWVSSDPHRYYVTWHTPRVRTTIAVMPGHDNLDSTWHVFVIFSQNES
jgi:hypothetical protein